MTMDICECRNCGASLEANQDSGRLCDHCRVDIVEKDVAKETGENWMATGSYAVRLHDRSIEIVRTADNSVIHLKDRYALRFEEMLVDIAESDRERFEKVCDALFFFAI